MKINNSWETFIWLVIWMIILTFISLWIINIVWYNKDMINQYEIKTIENILTQNTNSIFKKLNLDWLVDQETFYINKNTNKFEIFTWSENESYKYIDSLWNNISDLNNFDWDIFSRDMSININTINNVELKTLNLTIKNIILN